MVAVSRSETETDHGNGTGGGMQFSVPAKFLMGGIVITLMAFLGREYCFDIPGYSIAFFATLSGVVAALPVKRQYKP
jgi:hypothetical protein